MPIAKETGKRLGMGTNMFPSSALMGKNISEHMGVLSLDDEFIETADGFAGVFPGNYTS